VFAVSAGVGFVRNTAAVAEGVVRDDSGSCNVLNGHYVWEWEGCGCVGFVVGVVDVWYWRSECGSDAVFVS
jgi:hypothetical protein